MASLVKLCKIIKPLASKNTGIFYTVVRPKVHTHADFKPGPYPKTEKERVKAAEKYGLHPDEYEPYPDDGTGVGDYPKLPWKGDVTRDVNHPWDDPSLRRHHNETLHKHANILGQDRVDAGVKPLVPYGVAFTMFFGAIGTITLIWWLMEPYQVYRPVMEKQIPKPGVVHYTFEPAR